MRLIDADELWKLKFKSASERLDLDIEYLSGWNDAIDSIDENAPTAEPKYGHWVTTNKGDYAWECSYCGWGLSDYKTAYCYDCGAKMDEVKK